MLCYVIVIWVCLILGFCSEGIDTSAWGPRMGSVHVGSRDWSKDVKASFLPLSLSRMRHWGLGLRNGVELNMKGMRSEAFRYSFLWHLVALRLRTFCYSFILFNWKWKLVGVFYLIRVFFFLCWFGFFKDMDAFHPFRCYKQFTDSRLFVLF